MRVKTLLVAFVAMMLVGSMARAGFVGTITTTQGTGALAAYDIVRLFVKNNGANNALIAGNNTGTGLVAVEVAMIAEGSTLKLFTTSDISPSADGEPDVNISGQPGDVPFTWNATSTITPAGSAARIGNNNPSYYETMTVSGARYSRYAFDKPNAPVFDEATMIMHDSDPAQTGVPEYTPTAQPGFQNVRELRVSIASTSGAVAASTGNGYFAAVAVVPRGVQVTFSGQAAGEAGETEAIQMPVVPEPGTLTLLGIAAFGLLGRRRRNA